MRPRTLGLIVNPIAGMGGRVGLKGTDGPDMVARASALGAIPHSGTRAGQAMAVIALANIPDLELVTAAECMGEETARAAGWSPRVIGGAISGETRAADTERVAAAMRSARNALTTRPWRPITLPISSGSTLTCTSTVWPRSRCVTDWVEFPTITPDSGSVDHHPFQGEIDHFLGCIIEGKESHASVRDAVNTHEACFAIDRSCAEGGAQVQLNDLAPAR